MELRRNITALGSRPFFRGTFDLKWWKNERSYPPSSSLPAWVKSLTKKKTFLSYRNTRQMSLCLQAAFGVHPVMSLIKLWKTVFFLSWMWEIGLSSITWEQILSMNHLLSMIFRGQLFITWCPTVIGKMDCFFKADWISEVTGFASFNSTMNAQLKSNNRMIF